MCGDTLQNDPHPWLGGRMGLLEAVPFPRTSLLLGGAKAPLRGPTYMACFYCKKWPISLLELTPSPVAYGISFLTTWLKPMFQLNVGWDDKDRGIEGVQRAAGV